MWKLLRRSRTENAPDALQLDADWVRRALQDHHNRLIALEATQVARDAQHAVVLDQLQRLYRRVAARIAREQTAEPLGSSESPDLFDDRGPSPLELRRALRGR